MTKISHRRDPNEVPHDDFMRIFSENGSWFETRYQDLKVRYHKRNVVVVNQKIVGYGKDRHRLRRRLQKRGVDLTGSFWSFIPLRDCKGRVV